MYSQKSAGFARVNLFRTAARKEAGTEENYKGLRIHALPGLHEFIAGRAGAHLPRGAAVLDIAAGSGALSLRLKDLGYAVIGVDLVRENFRLHGQVPFLQADLNEDFAAALGPKDDGGSAALDGVFAVEIIEHLENPRHFLRQCYQLLKPGGRLVLTTPNPDNPMSRALFVCYHRFQWFAEMDYCSQGHISPLSETMLRHMCEENQFAVELLRRRLDGGDGGRFGPGP